MLIINLLNYNGSIEGLNPDKLVEEVSTTQEDTIQIIGNAEDRELYAILLRNISKSVENLHFTRYSEWITEPDIYTGKYRKTNPGMLDCKLSLIPETIKTIIFPLNNFTELGYQNSNDISNVRKCWRDKDFRVIIKRVEIDIKTHPNNHTSYTGRCLNVRGLATFKRYNILEMIEEMNSKKQQTTKVYSKIELLPTNLFAEILSYVDKKDVASLFYSSTLHEIKDPEVREFLEKNGFYIYVESLNKAQKYHTPLTFLVENKGNVRNNDEVLSLTAKLRECGANLEATNYFKNTALHMAAQSGNQPFITYLFNEMGTEDMYNFKRIKNSFNETAELVANVKHGKDSEISKSLRNTRNNDWGW